MPCSMPERMFSAYTARALGSASAGYSVIHVRALEA